MSFLFTFTENRQSRIWMEKLYFPRGNYISSLSHLTVGRGLQFVLSQHRSGNVPRLVGVDLSITPAFSTGSSVIWCIVKGLSVQPWSWHEFRPVSPLSEVVQLMSVVSMRSSRGGWQPLEVLRASPFCLPAVSLSFKVSFTTHSSLVFLELFPKFGYPPLQTMTACFLFSQERCSASCCSLWYFYTMQQEAWAAFVDHLSLPIHHLKVGLVCRAVCLNVSDVPPHIAPGILSSQTFYFHPLSPSGSICSVMAPVLWCPDVATNTAEMVKLSLNEEESIFMSPCLQENDVLLFS